MKYVKWKTKRLLKESHATEQIYLFNLFGSGCGSGAQLLSCYLRLIGLFAALLIGSFGLEGKSNRNHVKL